MIYKTFKIRHTLCDKLRWSHYRVLLIVKKDDAKEFYYKEAIKNNWSVRQLERDIHNISYERYILGKKDYSIIQETADKAMEETEEEARLFVKEPLLAKLTSVGNSDRSTHRPIGRKLRRNYSVCN